MNFSCKFGLLKVFDGKFSHNKIIPEAIFRDMRRKYFVNARKNVIFLRECLKH